jgi:putative Ca2+/H+ antiporter (TMEM165/GDT1 family)
MNFDQLKTVGTFQGHLLPAGVGVLAGMFFLFLVFKAGKLVMKLVPFLIAVAFFAAAYWWHTHIRS